jgi:hypothetical protein
MKKLPDVFEVKFCSSCACMTWHTAEGACEWSDEHASKVGQRSAQFREWLATLAADKVTETSIV